MGDNATGGVTSKLSMGRNVAEIEDSNVKRGEGRFTFWNDDTYEGGYKVVRDKQTLVKQDHGIYTTGDFNAYDTIWDEDHIGSELHVRSMNERIIVQSYNNGMEYKGSLDASGTMTGSGTFIFPDGSLLDAVWDQNKPVSDAVLKEPLGYAWKGECDLKELRFNAGNHFWDEIPVAIVPIEVDELSTRRGSIFSDTLESPRTSSARSKRSHRSKIKA